VTRVGFVGLGNIGKPMALRLASAPAELELDLSVYDVAPDPVAELEAAGAKAAGSVAELAARSDVICVMVRDDEQVREVLGDVLGVAHDGMVVVVHSTVAPATPRQLEISAARHGVLLVDAPVSGGAMGAADGSLAILVGGSDTAYAACSPVLARMGSLVVHAGPTGAGTKLKAQRLAEAAGLDLKALGEVVRHTDAITGGPGAIMHRETTAPLATDDFWHGVFSHVADLGEKDLGFAITLADELGVEVPLAREANDRLRKGLGL
jgi:3-hydroxyisobutyrate dehydrogenase-like beta-hydroxyacid dehydrogenase